MSWAKLRYDGAEGGAGEDFFFFRYLVGLFFRFSYPVYGGKCCSFGSIFLAYTARRENCEGKGSEKRSSAVVCALNAFFFVSSSKARSLSISSFDLSVRRVAAAAASESLIFFLVEFVLDW